MIKKADYSKQSLKNVKFTSELKKYDLVGSNDE